MNKSRSSLPIVSSITFKLTQILEQQVKAAMQKQRAEEEERMKAMNRQQQLHEELMAQKEMAEKNQNFVKDLFDKAEKDRRETER